MLYYFIHDILSMHIYHHHFFMFFLLKIYTLLRSIKITLVIFHIKIYSSALFKNTQLQHYLAGQLTTDVYLIAHSLGGIVASYLAYLKSIEVLVMVIQGTMSRVRGTITLDPPIDGLASDLP